MIIRGSKNILKFYASKLLDQENCDSFKLELDDGRFVMAGTLEGIRTLVETEGT